MSSAVDPAKLKVVELRAELSKRGLDSKGIKAALVKRLKDALEEELRVEIPETSIADTSTEDLDSSQQSQEEEMTPSECKLPDKVADPIEVPSPTSILSSEIDIEPLDDTQPASAEVQMETQEVHLLVPEPEVEPEVSKVMEEHEEELEVTPEEKIESPNETAKPDEKLENGDQNDEPKSRKSRWGGESENAESVEDETPSEINQIEEKAESEKMEEDVESKGEKRKHSSPSPDRSQRRRSKSPIKEDEPPIDNDKVQLSWYDSDLHLQLDKESFLSAKPYHEGAFGFAWAGVRATHGVNSGKVCFEVKITEELKWEDFSKHEKSRRDDHKSPSQSRDKPKSGDESVKKEDASEKSETHTTTQSENGENASEKTEDSETKTEESESKTEESEVKAADSETNTEESVEKAQESGPKSHEPELKSEDNPMEVDEKPKEESKSQEAVPEIEETTEEPIKTAEPEEEIQEAEPIPSHLLRVGWSIISTGLQLGEEVNSYGYESSGKFVTNKEFIDYGVNFGVNDVIASYIDLDGEEITINYSVNGESQSEATRIAKSDLPEDFAFFPHVLSRNYAFELNLGSKEAWFPHSAEFADFQFMEHVDEKVLGPVRPETRSECEVILMCGLPASGKTHWASDYIQSNPDKKYNLLGNSQLLDRMTVAGDALKNKYQGRWTVLIDKLQKCLNKLVEVAALRRRNYIIDQTNVFPSAQRRKLRPFEGFKRRAVVVVVGDEEQAKRQSLQEAQGGKDVPDTTILEMKANMSLPQKGDWVDEVVYAELDEAAAKSVVQKYNQLGRDAGYGIQKRFGYRDDRHKWQQNRRNDYRGGNYRDNRYHNNRFDRGPPRQNWHPQRPGGWNRDNRRDNRGPPPMGGGGRDWRNNNRGNVREHRQNRDLQGGNNYNRNRNAPGRSPGGNWQSSGSNWNHGGGGGNWNNQAWNQSAWGGGGGGGNNQGGWSQSSQNQWKYGGGGGSNQSYGGYGSNWNYYGQYPQNWNTQGQTSASGATANASQYGGYSQQEWAQYAQQYAQQGQTSTTSAITPSTPQK